MVSGKNAIHKVLYITFSDAFDYVLSDMENDVERADSTLTEFELLHLSYLLYAVNESNLCGRNINNINKVCNKLFCDINTPKPSL